MLLRHIVTTVLNTGHVCKLLSLLMCGCAETPTCSPPPETFGESMDLGEIYSEFDQVNSTGVRGIVFDAVHKL